MSKTNVLWLLLMGQFLYVSCGGGSSQQKEVAAAPSARPGVTQNMPVRKIGTTYAVDAIGPVSNPLDGKNIQLSSSQTNMVRGWAVDEPNKAVAANVDVVIDRVPYAASYGLLRKDVAEYFKTPVYENSGFQYAIPAGQLTKGAHTFCIRVVGNDGKGYVQSREITMVIE